MLAGCVGKLGRGEVNFLLTTPNPEPTYATIEQNIRKSINGEKSNPPKPGRNRLPTAT
jgi:hypothetical protein